MFSKFQDLLKESDFACSLLMGVSVAVAFVFGGLTIAMGIAAIVHSLWWALGFVLFGVLTGLAIGLAAYICNYL